MSTCNSVSLERNVEELQEKLKKSVAAYQTYCRVSTRCCNEDEKNDLLDDVIAFEEPLLDLNL